MTPRILVNVSELFGGTYYVYFLLRRKKPRKEAKISSSEKSVDVNQTSQ
jgi:hypothetical protein